MAIVNSIKASGEEEHKINTTPEKGYQRLKKWCTTNLNLLTSEVQDMAVYSQLTWYCKPLGYSTIQGRIDKMYDNKWKKESSDSTDDGSSWSEIKKLWDNDAHAKSYINDASESMAATISADKYKKWCETTLDAKLYAASSYQIHYKIAKSVCVDLKVQQKLKTTKNLRQAIEEAQ
ncbi:hypothetical protein [Candidatus Mycoplasma haematohominis]|uniref:hypothetical protein n=1 Tax=Candidatus Mycoplasma haematohominis TaxID=1494318 RepID=UPI001C0A696B|nr:hypothetical protein [Candidatus Mycoplasma haemohominis]